MYVIAAIYIILCQLGAALSIFSGAWASGYALFAVLMCVMIYYLPQKPLRDRLSAEQAEVLTWTDQMKSEVLTRDMKIDALHQLARLH